METALFKNLAYLFLLTYMVGCTFNDSPIDELNKESESFANDSDLGLDDENVAEKGTEAKDDFDSDIKKDVIQFDGVVNVEDSEKEDFYAFRVSQSFDVDPDITSSEDVSTLRIFEDGVELGPAHSLHRDIRELGEGRFSHWHTNLYFSASDNTDPRTNGRTYQYLKE